MKKLIALLLAACLILGLCACGKTNVENPPVEENPTPSQPAATDPAPTDPAPTEPDPTEPEATEPPETQPTEPDLSDFELAQSCIDLSVEELYALIGEPESSDYAPSCLNPDVGEDGNLYYDGFIVYTYREGDVETVSYVEEIE